jgi:hypothetical protein
MNKPDSERVIWAYRLGKIAQGLILGGLLALALMNLLAEAGDVRLFRYQNF